MRAANSDYTRYTIPQARKNNRLPNASAGKGQIRIWFMCSSMWKNSVYQEKSVKNHLEIIIKRGSSIIRWKSDHNATPFWLTKLLNRAVYQLTFHKKLLVKIWAQFTDWGFKTFYRQAINFMDGHNYGHRPGVIENMLRFCFLLFCIEPKYDSSSGTKISVMIGKGWGMRLWIWTSIFKEEGENVQLGINGTYFLHS